MRHLHAMPPDMPYFDRAHLGLTQLLRTLGARVRTTNPWIHETLRVRPLARAMCSDPN